MAKEINIPDICDYCHFHGKEIENISPATKERKALVTYSDNRVCHLIDRAFNINEIFDGEGHHKCRPSWCDVKKVEIHDGWEKSL